MLAGPIVHDLNFQVAQALPWGLVNAVHCNREQAQSCTPRHLPADAEQRPAEGPAAARTWAPAVAMPAVRLSCGLLAVGSDRLSCKTS